MLQSSPSCVKGLLDFPEQPKMTAAGRSPLPRTVLLADLPTHFPPTYAGGGSLTCSSSGYPGQRISPLAELWAKIGKLLDRQACLCFLTPKAQGRARDQSATRVRSRLEIPGWCKEGEGLWRSAKPGSKSEQNHHSVSGGLEKMRGLTQAAPFPHLRVQLDKNFGPREDLQRFLDLHQLLFQLCSSVLDTQRVCSNRKQHEVFRELVLAYTAGRRAGALKLRLRKRNPPQFVYQLKAHWIRSDQLCRKIKQKPSRKKIKDSLFAFQQCTCTRRGVCTSV